MKKIFQALVLLLGWTASAQNIEYVVNGRFDNPIITPPPAGTLTGLKFGAMPSWDVDRCFPFLPVEVNSVDVYTSTQTSLFYAMPVPSSTNANPESMIGIFGDMPPDPALLNQETAVNDLIAPLPAGRYSFSVDLRQRASMMQPNEWHFEVYLQNRSETGVGSCNRTNEKLIYSDRVEVMNWIYPQVDVCIEDTEANFFDRISIRMVYHGAIPPAQREYKYIYVDNMSLEEIQYNPDFVVDQVSCVGYGRYQVSVSGHFNGGVSNWHLFADNSIPANPGTEILSSRLVGVTGNTAIIDVTGQPGDQLVLKHGTYGTCVRWREQSQIIEIPCGNGTLDAGFSYDLSCNQNVYTLTVEGEANPCDTYWQYNLIDMATGNILNLLGYYNNNSGSYNSSQYTFPAGLLKPCHDYAIQHGVWNECVSWKQQIKYFTTVECTPLTAQFDLRKSVTGPAETQFLYNDPILFDGRPSTGETQYYVDIWKWNGSAFVFIAKKNINGWTQGQADVFDVKAEFPNVAFYEGRFKLKLAVANGCVGWLPVEREFMLSCPICKIPSNVTNTAGEDKDRHSSNKLTIFPNPVSSELNISSEVPIVNVEILDKDGSKLSTYTSEKLDVKHLKKGVYIIKIRTADGKVHNRQVVKD